MMRFYEIPQGYDQELNKFSQALQEFRAGNIDPVRFRAHRVGFGIYEQRTESTFMVRIRCAGGGITPLQLERAAEISARYAASFMHVTTRFELQMHDVPYDNILPVLRELKEVGLSTRGGGGNTIRNITASTDSGIAPGEAFDVTPFAIALTSRMIQEPDSFNLPRKFKIAFSNNEEDTAYATLMDLGFIARIKEGRRGFRVFAAGGMGAKSRAGSLLHDFVPQERVYAITKALKRLFDQHGNRKNKFVARIRFLWDKLGDEQFRRLYAEELERVEQEGVTPLELPELKNEARDPGLPAEEPTDDGFGLWESRYVSGQKQEGLAEVKLPLILGDITNADAGKLARLLAPFGENTLRFSKTQNIHLRNIPKAYVANIYNGIRGMRSHSERPPFLGEMIACTGAATCKLGICLPRGLMTAIANRLAEGSLDLGAIGDLKVNASGCPNSCGQHHAADLGFYGKVSRVDGQMMPAYYLVAGAKVTGQGSRLVEKLGEVAAKNIPDLLYDFLAEWESQKEQHPDCAAFLRNGGKETLKRLAKDYNGKVPTQAENPSYFQDWGSNEPFSVAKRGVGECSAGLFDLIDADVKTIKEQKETLLRGEAGGDLRSAIKLTMRASARMLLIAKGLEPITDREIYLDFQQHFIETGLVPGDFSYLVDWAKQERYDLMAVSREQVSELADFMVNLYKEMDITLRFPAEKAAAG